MGAQQTLFAPEFPPADLTRFPTAAEAETRKRRVTERPLDSWQSLALAVVEEYAKTHEYFLAEDVREYGQHLLPEPPEPRAWGAVLKAAVRRGIIMADGTAKARTSNNSPKTRWRSLKFRRDWRVE